MKRTVISNLAIEYYIRFKVGQYSINSHTSEKTAEPLKQGKLSRENESRPHLKQSTGFTQISGSQGGLYGDNGIG